MAGRGSLAGVLAYGNANEIVREMAAEVLPVVPNTPVLAGVNGTDPFCLFDPFLDDLKRMGFAGVQNFPTVGLIDGLFRANLEETGMSYGLEVDMIAKAHGKDMLTTPYVFNADEAVAMAKAGADVIVCHFGLTTGGAIGAGTATKLEECPALAGAWAEAAMRVRRDIIVLIHGGPVAEPDDAQYVHRPHGQHSRLLRCVLDGTAPDRARRDGANAAVQSTQTKTRKGQLTLRMPQPPSS